jgi:uncharacterized repeat protein (TIGR01451 family)
MQQTMIDSLGFPVWPTPDVTPYDAVATRNETAVSVTIAIANNGSAPLCPPFYITLYKESVSPANILIKDTVNTLIRPHETVYTTITIPNIIPFQPVIRIVARINDSGGVFPIQPECDELNNEISINSPALDLMMRIDAKLNGIVENGALHNPQTVLLSEPIEYTITAFNASYHTNNLIITDTLPAYLNYVTGSSSHAYGLVHSTTTVAPVRDILQWTLQVVSMTNTKVRFEAIPDMDVCASQPLLINYAWIRVSDTISISTANNTYHQGADAALVTFSSMSGGAIYNAKNQSVEYKRSVVDNILIVPDEGYVFAGWSHDDYISLRGEQIKARSGIMHCDTLTIYGSVELTAHFIPAFGVNEKEDYAEQHESSDKIWSSGNTLFIKTSVPNSIVRIFSIDGVMIKEYITQSKDTEHVTLLSGIYIVNVNKGKGRKVIIVNK